MSNFCCCGGKGILKLTTRSGLASNGKLLLAALSDSGCCSNTEAGAVGSESAGNGFGCSTGTRGVTSCNVNTMLVHVCIEDYKRSTFLQHAEYLYSITLSFSPQASISVIPCFPSVSSGTPSLSESATDAGVVRNEEGISLKGTPEQHPEFGDPLYSTVAVGGTFDRLHAGHKLLLTYAALYTTQFLLVGVASDALLGKKKLKEMLQPLDVRMERISGFLSLLRKDISVEIIPITDVYGSTDVRPDLEAIILSEETKQSLDLINEARIAHQLPRIDGVVIPTVTYGPGETLISSTALREWEQKEGSTPSDVE